MDDTARYLPPDTAHRSSAPARSPGREATLPPGDGTTRPVAVWDLATRVFHWLIVVCVLVAWATGGAPGAWFVVHQAAGYLILVALVFRLVWGIAGSRHSRFADFVRPWRAVRRHLVLVSRLHPPRAIGHNPAGGWMVLALLTALAAAVASGLFAAGREIEGPFAAVLGPSLASLMGAVHEVAVDLLLALVVLHLAGVAIESLLTRDNLVRAMWTGRKALTPAEARGEGRMVPVAWAVATVIASGVFVWGVLA